MKRFLAALLGFISMTGGAMASDTAHPQQATEKTAIFAGGCFWCMEPQFAELPGVIRVVSGYTGGHTVNPTYAQVSTGGTGHLEAISVTYDSQVIGYDRLLAVFWRNIDPLDEKGQFCDKGSQYLAGIFTADAEQARLAESSRERVAAMFGRPVATVIRPASAFYPAEDEHQEYYLKHRDRYKRYRQGCGRDQRLEELWQGKQPAALPN